MTSSAIIWSGALQASATLLAREAGARWGIDQPGGEYLPDQKAGTARRMVELAAQIIMELPEDEAAIPQAKEAAQRWLEGRGR